jgi:hypothetical protein
VADPLRACLSSARFLHTVCAGHRIHFDDPSFNKLRSGAQLRYAFRPVVSDRFGITHYHTFFQRLENYHKTSDFVANLSTFVEKPIRLRFISPISPKPDNTI